MVNKDYSTTFSKEVELKMPSYISADFLEDIAQMIASRVPAHDLKIVLTLSTDVGADFSTSSWDAVGKILEEAKKYNRVIGTIRIETGIVNQNKVSSTHYSVDLRMQRIEHKYHGYLRVYAVAGDTSDSQHVIDWGTGLIEDFGELNIDDKDLSSGTIVINAKDGSVHGFVKKEQLTHNHNTVQKVEVVNPVETVPPKWSDKNVVLTVVSIMVAIILTAIGWAYFQN